MVRNYKRKTDRAFISKEDLKKALKAVFKEKLSIRNAAQMYNLKKSTLADRVKKKRLNAASVEVHHISLQVSDSGNSSSSDDDDAGIIIKGRDKYKSRQIFSDAEEIQFKEYLIYSSKIYFGLTYIQARELAYDYSVKLGRTPALWTANKIAGTEWMKSFMKRHPNLSLRIPENTSLARASAFNKTNVSEFFDNYVSCLTRFKFTAARIYNLDETGVSTVLQSPKVCIN